MLNDNTNLDVESTDHEQPLQSELDPLIQPDVKVVPSKQEMHVARAQFLTLCWTMFVMGWTNSSTGPLLPRIQIFYDVSCNLYVIPKAGTISSNISILSGRNWSSILDICFTAYGK